LLLSLVVACWLGVLPCRRAAAADAESVRLSIPDCGDASGSQIAQLVALELASRENLTLDDSSDGIAASLRCSDDSAVIEVVDPQRDEPLILEMQLAQTRPEARPRLLALAIAELIATSRLEQTPADVRGPVAEETQRAASVFVAGGVARAYQPGQWSPEIAAGAAYSFGVLALTAEVDFDWASRQTADASVDASTLSLALAPSLALLRAPLAWDVRLGVRFGYAWLEGTPRSASFAAGSISGVFVAPIAATALAVALTQHWAVRVSFELGYVILPVRGFGADGEQLLELKGFRAAAIAGPAFAF
jgi:hypothetical protein